MKLNKLKEKINRQWFLFKDWYDYTLNPNNCCCRIYHIYDKIKKVYQICTPWFGHKRWLMNEVCCNYGKLLETGLSTVGQRSRDGSCEYYLLTTYFGRVKFYKILYVDKKSKKPTNAFLSLVVPVVCGEDNSNEIIKEKVCVYKGWAFTHHQVLEALSEIRNKSKSLNWDVMASEKRVYKLAEDAIKYLNGKSVYFTYKGMSKEEAEKEFRMQIYLMQRDVRDWNAYVNQIQECIELALEPQSESRNKKLKKLLKALMIKIKNAGYNSTWDLYAD